MLEETIERVNEGKVDIIERDITNLDYPRTVKHGSPQVVVRRMLEKLAPDAVRTLDMAMTGCKVKETQLRAAIEVILHTIGKPKVQMDITGDVTPYNILVRQLNINPQLLIVSDTLESISSQENEETNV